MQTPVNDLICQIWTLIVINDQPGFNREYLCAEGTNQGYFDCKAVCISSLLFLQFILYSFQLDMVAYFCSTGLAMWALPQ
jgi:hypothetical protein